jgi:hypothetical protein
LATCSDTVLPICEHPTKLTTTNPSPINLFMHLSSSLTPPIDLITMTTIYRQLVGELLLRQCWGAGSAMRLSAGLSAMIAEAHLSPFQALDFKEV